MKKSIYIVGILGLMLIFNGCGNQKDGDQNSDKLESVKEGLIKNENRESTENFTMDEQIEIDSMLKEGDEANLSVKLDEMKDDNNQMDVDEKNIEKCDEGAVYNTQLKKCFENGSDDKSSEDKVKIDSVVKECNDNGGIYNVQVEKCFID